MLGQLGSANTSLELQAFPTTYVFFLLFCIQSELYKSYIHMYVGFLDCLDSFHYRAFEIEVLDTI